MDVDFAGHDATSATMPEDALRQRCDMYVGINI
jgi:hypothetical protein